jgi:hypothetical protein
MGKLKIVNNNAKILLSVSSILIAERREKYKVRETCLIYLFIYLDAKTCLRLKTIYIVSDK